MDFLDVLVSIIVPMYNVEKKLVRCLDSLKNQTYKNIEIILVNDGSPDNIEEICLKYISNDNRFNYYRKINGGLSSARNFGISKAKGKYIYFIDSDDFCESNIIECLIDNIRLGAQISACGYYIEYPNNNLKLDKKVESTGIIDCPSFLIALDNQGMFNVVWNKMYDLEIIKKYNLLFDEKAMPGEDLIFNCNYLKHINKSIISEKKLYHYMREDEVTLVNKYDKDLLEKIKYFISTKEQLMMSINVEEKYLRENISNTAISYAFSCLTNLYRKDCKLKSSDKIRDIKEIINISRKNDNYLNSTITNRFYNLFFKFVKYDRPVLMFMIYKILFGLRNNFNKIYIGYRALILKKNSK